MNDETFYGLTSGSPTGAHPHRRRRRHRPAHPYFSGTAERRVADWAPATTRNVSRLWIIHSRQQRRRGISFDE